MESWAWFLRYWVLRNGGFGRLLPICPLLLGMLASLEDLHEQTLQFVNEQR